MIPLKSGDNVRIKGSEKNSDIIYKIRKIKKSQDGTTLYLLKSKLSAITLLFYETKNVHLEKADE